MPVVMYGEVRCTVSLHMSSAHLIISGIERGMDWYSYDEAALSYCSESLSLLSMNRL